MTGNVRNLMGVGMPAEQAAQVGLSAILAVTAAGTTAADATIIKKQTTFVNMTASGSDGVKLPADADIGVEYIVYNSSGSTGKVYPPTSGTINGDTATSGAKSLTTLKVAAFIRYSSTGWIMNLTA